MKKYAAVVNGVRRIIERWAISRSDLIADANVGDTTIYVVSTRRFQPGDQFLIYNDNPNGEDAEAGLYIASIIDQNTITLVNPLTFNWPMANGAHVVKTSHNMFVKAVHLGEPNVITDLPAITVQPKSASSEYMTIRGTKERYDIEIGIYVSGTTLEEGDLFLWDMVDVIQYGLKRNFYPLLDDFKTTTLIQDVQIGDSYIKVADTSAILAANNAPATFPLQIEDTYEMDALYVDSICDANTIHLSVPISYPYSASNTTVIVPGRLPFNSWPSNANFGLINKGTLLKAATISYFVEEYEPQQQPYVDPQLS